jgi:hypothetical protein
MRPPTGLLFIPCMGSMSMETIRKLVAGKPEELIGNLSQHQFAHHKFHVV